MDDRFLVSTVKSNSVPVVDPASGITRTTVETDPNPYEVVTMGSTEQLRRVDTELHPDGIAYAER